MAQTHVKMTISHPIEIGNVDVQVEIRDGTKLLGNLTISTGSIDWRKRGAHSSVQKSWAEFSDLMKANP
jgi:hypothetical protein